MNEFALIDRYFRRDTNDPSVRIAIGDDGAVVAPTPGFDLIFSVDMLVEGRHFLPDVAPFALGHKTLAVNLSDLAAMGATPRWALLAGALPDLDERWLEQFTRGLFALADRFGVALIGGDTTRGPRNLCLTIIGETPAGTALTRGGAKVGDDIYVSGTLGDAALALAALQGRATLAAADLVVARHRLEMPEPRVALGTHLRGVATAAIDISDGLTGDLSHILERSGAGATIDVAAVPRSTLLNEMLGGDDRDLALSCLLAGGDDYELCFTAAATSRDAIARIAMDVGVALTRIGHVTTGAGIVVRDEHGAPLANLPHSFDHFG
jgi:thiamine-monophosphate kinase